MLQSYYFNQPTGTGPAVTQRKVVTRGPGKIVDIVLGEADAGVVVELRETDVNGQVLAAFYPQSPEPIAFAGGLSIPFRAGLHVTFTPLDASQTLTVTIEQEGEPE